MQRRLFASPGLSLGLLGCLLATACGGSETHTADDAGGDTSAGGDSAVVAVSTTFKPVCTADSTCSNGVCSGGVCVDNPQAAEHGALTDPANDYQPSTEKLQTACVDQPLAEAIKGLPDIKTVTMWGRVDRFGGGDITADVEVDVFKLGDFHPEACAGIVDADAREACFLDPKKVGTPIAGAISIDPDQAAVDAKLDVKAPKKSGETCTTHFDCPNGYECRKTKTDTAKLCIKAHGVYAIPGVPTNTELVIRLRKHIKSADWHDSFYWDIVLFSDHLDPKGEGHQPTKFLGTDTYHVNPTIVGQAQWALVPQTLGLAEIKDGNGVIGGRIRDCGVLGKRGGFPIHFAKLGLGVPAAGLAFFNDNEDDTVPIKDKHATDTLGRFAAVDLPPGANRVAASVEMDGKVLKLGAQDVFIVPGALMIVSLPGRIPVLTK